MKPKNKPKECKHEWKFASFVNVDGALYAGFACDKCQEVKMGGITQEPAAPKKEAESKQVKAIKTQLKSLDPEQEEVAQPQEFTEEEKEKIREVKELLNRT